MCSRFSLGPGGAGAAMRCGIQVQPGARGGAGVALVARRAMHVALTTPS